MRLPLRKTYQYDEWPFSNYCNGNPTYLEYYTDIAHTDIAQTVTPPGQPFLGFHSTPLSALTRGTPHVPGSTGILTESGSLRYGSCTHNGMHGVNLYSYPPFKLFQQNDFNWCFLEVKAVNGTKLKGGSRCRYCVTGPVGERCDRVVIKAVHVMTHMLPDMILLT